MIALLLSACSNGQREQQARVHVALSELTTYQMAYDDRTVETTGVVREFVELGRRTHYWIEDEAKNRVGLRPSRLAASLVNQTVEVIGRFSFSDRAGRVLTIDRISPVPSPNGTPRTRGS